MKLGAKEEFEVPEGVELKLTGRTVEVSGPKGKLTRTFDLPRITLKAEGRKISIESESARRKDKAAVSTIKAHIQNMCKGVTQGFTYKLRVVYSHFPITVKVEGKRVLIHNFLGERSPRVAKIVGDTTVEVSGDEITVRGINKEDVGQTAFNIEQATSVKYRDLRIFQDGCYITEKV
jgi:large subunit ribosomal protein L6